MTYAQRDGRQEDRFLAFLGGLGGLGGYRSSCTPSCPRPRVRSCDAAPRSPCPQPRTTAPAPASGGAGHDFSRGKEYEPPPQAQGVSGEAPYPKSTLYFSR